MIISIVNHTKGKVTDEELQTAIRAINRQIAEDFVPYWSMAATLRLEGRSAAQPDSAQAADMRGDAVIYLWDEADVEGALGYHFQNNRGIPFGFVFTSVAEQLGQDWSATLSHEALELLGDPETNLLVIGPHPDPAQDREVFFWFEMCDAVQAEIYEIEGIKVSNFLLPLYFTGTRDTDEPGRATISWDAPTRARRCARSASTRAATSGSSIRSSARTIPTRCAATRRRRSATKSSSRRRRRGARLATRTARSAPSCSARPPAGAQRRSHVPRSPSHRSRERPWRPPRALAGSGLRRERWSPRARRAQRVLCWRRGQAGAAHRAVARGAAARRG